MRCPALSSRFPGVLPENLPDFAAIRMMDRELATQDGKSDEDWIGDPRPTVVGDGEQDLYGHFMTRVTGMGIEVFDHQCPTGTTSPKFLALSSVSDSAIEVVEASLKIRELLDNDQIVRFTDKVHSEPSNLY